MMSPRRFKQSFTHALHGVGIAFRQEQSFRIQSALAVCALILGVLLGIRASEFIVVLLLIGSVLSLEMLNSILERIVDAFKPRIHPVVRDIKDLMAGVVLVASVTAGLIGLAIFVPRLIALF